MKLYLTIGVSIASCERSFSNLKMIKPYLRSTMNADRLSALSILSIERDYVQKPNFEDIVADFTSAKARKVQFWGEYLSFIFLIHLFTIYFIFGFFSSNIELLRPGTLFVIISFKRLLERDTISKFAAIYLGPVLKL